MRPTITVVVPVLNEERFLAETLRSLRAQTFTDFELVVVDNGSTDRSVEIARQFADKVLEEPVRGSASAMHRGFREARGEFIASADADTLYPPDWLEKMVAAFDSPSVVAVYGPIGFRECKNPTRTATVAGYTVLVSASRVFGVHQVGAANLGMRRAAYDRAGGYSPFAELVAPDLRLVRCLARLGKVRYVPGLVCYTSNRRFAGKNLVPGSWRAFRTWLEVATGRKDLRWHSYWARESSGGPGEDSG
jgi:glycosyltransferase involved in cell wall biosynthesis